MSELRTMGPIGAAAGILMLIAGCALGPDYKEPRPELEELMTTLPMV